MKHGSRMPNRGGSHARASAAQRGQLRGCSRSLPPSRRIVRCGPRRRRCARRRRDPGGQRQRHARSRGQADVARAARSAASRRTTASRPWPAGSRTSSASPIPSARCWREWTRPERHGYSARVRALGRDRHHLREPPQRHRRRRRAVPEIEQRRDFAGRLGKRRIERGDS